LRTVVLNSENRLLYFDGKIYKGEVDLTGTKVEHCPKESTDRRGSVVRISNIESVSAFQSHHLFLAAGSFREADSWVRYLTNAASSSTVEGGGEKYESLEELASSGDPMKSAGPSIKQIKERRQREYNENKTAKEYLLRDSDILFEQSDDDDDDDDDDDARSDTAKSNAQGHGVEGSNNCNDNAYNDD